MRSAAQTSRLHSVLLVDDDDVEAEALQRGLDAHGLDIPLVRARNGREALSKLEECALRGPGELPAIVLLDLNMPVMGGIEFLESIQGDERWRALAVFVMTNSADERHRAECHAHGIAGYFVKDEVGHNHSAVASMIETRLGAAAIR